MDNPLPNRRGVALFIERYGALVIAAAAAVVIFLNSSEVVACFTTKGWQISNLYAAVFNWSAIQTGFAFGVYGFVVGKNEGFIQEIRDTIAMKRFLRYVKRANIGGFILTLTSLPLTVVNPLPTDRSSLVFILLLVWFALFIWTFLAFLRIAYSFGHLSSVRDQPKFYGA
jgi:hypothetical protein